MKSVLENRTKSITTSGNSTIHDGLLSSITPDYNTEKGFTTIKNPGWIKLELDSPAKIAYIRFLLWDNCGTKKSQPSNRKYLYRFLIAENKENKENKDIVWEAIYENSLNPSNGWQEFYFEDVKKDITAIKIQFFQNSSTSKDKETTKLVSIQAYEEPTLAIKELTNEKEVTTNNVAPIPNLGYIKNRIIIGNEQQQLGLLIEEEIHKKIISYISHIEKDEKTSEIADDLRALKEDLANSSNNELIKQINLFHSSILRPINDYSNRIKKKYL